MTETPPADNVRQFTVSEDDNDIRLDRWFKRNLPQVWRGVEAGATAIGTVESYLVARISGGRAHITDASNASRTQLYNLHEGNWDDSLLELFEVPRLALPTIVANHGSLAISPRARSRMSFV